MPITPQNKFRKYVHSPFTLARDGVKSIVEADGKITIRQRNLNGDDDDVIETSAAFILKLYMMMEMAERPFEFKFRDITVKVDISKVTIRQEDEEKNFDEIITNDRYILDLSKMLRATRTLEFVDVPYRDESA